MMRAGLEPTSSDYEPDKLPVTLSHQITLCIGRKGLEPLIFCSQNRRISQTMLPSVLK